MARGLAAEACRETRNNDQTMMIERTTFGTITIDGKTYEHEKGCKQLILGSGQMGNLHLSLEAEAYFAKRAVGCGCSPRLRRSVRSTDRALGRPDFFT
jgi:hypothetical protein